MEGSAYAKVLWQQERRWHAPWIEGKKEGQGMREGESWLRWTWRDRQALLAKLREVPESRVELGLTVEGAFFLSEDLEAFPQRRGMEETEKAKGFEEMRGHSSARAEASCKDLEEIRLEGSLGPRGPPPGAGQEPRAQVLKEQSHAKARTGLLDP